MIGVWVKVLNVPYRIVFPLILLFCIIGVYAINLSIRPAGQCWVSGFWAI